MSQTVAWVLVGVQIFLFAVQLVTLGAAVLLGRSDAERGMELSLVAMVLGPVNVLIGLPVILS